MDLKEIVSDYDLNFNQRSCQFVTGYRHLPEFTVKFQTVDLFHLLGIHKLNTGLRPNLWLEMVKNGQFGLKAYSNYQDILPRIRNYDFFYEVFYQDKVKICILDKDLTRNTMKLSVIFYKTTEAKTVVIGLRKTSQGHYVPVTLHENRNNPYRHNKTTVIKAIKWQ